MHSLGDVRPRNAMNDVENGALCDAELSGDLALAMPASSPQPSDLWNVFCAELGAVNLFAFSRVSRPRKPVPSLPVFVGHILGVSCKEEVVRSDTGRVVAPVTDVQAGGDRPEVQLPREPVGVSSLAVRVDRSTVAVCPEHATVPATARLYDVSPEPFLDAAVSPCKSAWIATAKSSVSSLGRFDPELFSAMSALVEEPGFFRSHGRIIAQDCGCIQLAQVGVIVTA